LFVFDAASIPSESISRRTSLVTSCESEVLLVACDLSSGIEVGSIFAF